MHAKKSSSFFENETKKKQIGKGSNFFVLNAK